MLIVAAFGAGSALADSKASPPVAEEVAEGEVILVQEGEASFYGKRFHGRKTASGEIFDMNKRTAASTVLPLGSRAVVTNLGNGRSVEVLINDRGPHAKDRIIDLSRRAAADIDMIDAGTADVRVELYPAGQADAAALEKIEAMLEDLGEAVIPSEERGG